MQDQAGLTISLESPHHWVPEMRRYLLASEVDNEVPNQSADDLATSLHCAYKRPDLRSDSQSHKLDDPACAWACNILNHIPHLPEPSDD